MDREGGSFEIDSDGSGRSLGEFQPRMAGLVREVNRADLRNFRTLGGEREWQRIIARTSLPIAVRLTREARSLVSDVVAACVEPVKPDQPRRSSSLPPAFLSFELAMDTAVGKLGPDNASKRAVEDIAFLVQLELRQRDERLARLNDSVEALTVIGECDGALRRIRKGLGAIDRGIVQLDGGPPSVEFASELRDSLTVRRAYARARAYFVSCGEPRADTLESCLRGAAARIDFLAEGDVAPLLRVRDRLHAFDLQARLRAWLRLGPSGAVDGARLWEDIAGFFEMLTLVNRRQELVEHDAQTVGQLLASEGDTAIADDQRGELLASLVGLDDELDVLIQKGSCANALRAALERVGDHLGIRSRRHA